MSSKRSGSSGGGIASKVPFVGGGSEKELEDYDDEVIDKAVRRLNQEGEETSKANIEEMARFLELEEQDTGDVKIGFIQDEDEKTIADQDLVAPEKLKERSPLRDIGYLERDDKLVRIMTITNWPSHVEPGILESLYTTNANVRVSQHIEPRDVGSALSKLKRKINRIGARLSRKREKGKQDTQDVIEDHEKVNNLIWAIITGKTHLYDFSVYIEIVADQKQTLDRVTRRLLDVFSGRSMDLTACEKYMTQAQNTVAPAARNNVGDSRTLMQETTAACAFPFIGPELVDPDGTLFGFDKGGKPILFDPYDLSSYVSITTGKQGSGKSFAKKWEILLLHYLQPDFKTWVLDPKSDFRDLAEKIGGEVIEFGGDTKVNPFDLKAGAVHNPEKAWQNKMRMLLGMFRTYFGDEWSREFEGALLRIIRLAYYKYGITPDTDTHHKVPPIMQDVMDISYRIANRQAPLNHIELERGAHPNQDEIWKRMKEEQQRMGEQDIRFAEILYNSLETFRSGGLNSNLNGRTNVDFDSTLVVFDMSEFADSNEAPLMMYVLLDLVYQHCSRSKNDDMLVADEAHYILNNRDALEFLNIFVRHHRHSNTRISLLSQTCSEFIVDKGDDDLRREIYKTADIKRIFYHKNLNEETIDFHDLTTSEQNFITRAQQGNAGDYSECLMEITGAGKIPCEVDVPEYERYICDDDLNPWDYLYEQNEVTREELAAMDEEEAEFLGVPDHLFAEAGVQQPLSSD